LNSQQALQRNRFLEALYEVTPMTEKLVVSRFAPNRNYIATIAEMSSLDEIIDGDESDTYFGVAARNAEFGDDKEFGHRRGTAADVASISAVFLDLDVSDHLAHKNDAGNFLSMDQAHDFLDHLSIMPSCVVSSGHGLQAYWFLTSALTPEDAAPLLHTFHDLQPRIQFALYGKHGKEAPGPDQAVTGDLTRVLRLPGTFNYKVAADVRPCEVVSELYHIRYTPRTILRAFTDAGRDIVASVPARAAQVAGASAGVTQTSRSTQNHVTPSLQDFLNTSGRAVSPEALRYLSAELQERRDIVRDALVDKLDWEVVGDFEDDFCTGYHLLRPGGSSAQSGTIGGCVGEKTDYETGQVLPERCMTDSLTVWSSAAEPFCSLPEAARRQFPTFDGLRVLKILGIIPEDLPIIGTIDSNTGEISYDVDHNAVDNWRPKTSPSIIMPDTARFTSIDPFAAAMSMPHGEMGRFTVEMFPPSVVAEAKLRFLESGFLSPIAALMQVYAEAILACSGADVICVNGGGGIEYSSSMNAFMLTIGNPGTGKDAVVENLNSDYVSELLDEFTVYFPKPRFPPIPVFEEPTDEEVALTEHRIKQDKAMRKSLSPHHGSIVIAVKSPEGISTCSASVPFMLIASSEGHDIKVAFGLRFPKDVPSSIANDHYDVKAGKKIGGAQAQGRDDRFSANSALTIIGAVQPAVAGALLTPLACQEIGMTHRFDLVPLRELVVGFDEVQPMKDGMWRRMTGLLMSGFYNHALASAKLEANFDGTVRVQRWGRTQVVASQVVRHAYNSVVTNTVNISDSDDIDVSLRAKRARKALGVAGIFACLESVAEWESKVKFSPAIAGVVEFNPASDIFRPIMPGTDCYISGAGDPVRFVAPRAKWTVERDHFAAAWKLTEEVERYTLNRILELDDESVSSATKAAAREDLIKARSSEHAVARERGDRTALDECLRDAFAASLPLQDDEGWFKGSTTFGPQAIRKMVRTLKVLNLHMENDVVERRQTNSTSPIFWRWKVDLG